MITLKESRPQLYKELSKNNSHLSTDSISFGSNKKVLWKGMCGHEWEATVKNRVNGSGCPYCSGNKVLRGYNDLAFQAPDIVSEWADDNFKNPYEYRFSLT